jgi:hypothetical protein
MTTEQLERMASEARELLAQTKLLQLKHRHGDATYDEMANAAKAYARAFDLYHRAKYGKPKKIDYRALLR